MHSQAPLNFRGWSDGNLGVYMIMMIYCRHTVHIGMCITQHLEVLESSGILFRIQNNESYSGMTTVLWSAMKSMYTTSGTAGVDMLALRHDFCEFTNHWSYIETSDIIRKFFYGAFFRCCRCISDVICDVIPGKLKFWRIAKKSSDYVQRRVYRDPSTLEKFIPQTNVVNDLKVAEKYKNVTIFGGVQGNGSIFGGGLVIYPFTKFISPVSNTKKSQKCRTCWHPCSTTSYQISSKNFEKKSYGNSKSKNKKVNLIKKQKRKNIWYGLRQNFVTQFRVQNPVKTKLHDNQILFKVGCNKKPLSLIAR